MAASHRWSTKRQSTDSNGEGEFKRASARASALAKPPEVITGYLEKRGDKGIVKTWKKRFFVLQDNQLIYKRAPEDLKALGGIELEHAHSIDDTNPAPYSKSESEGAVKKSIHGARDSITSAPTRVSTGGAVRGDAAKQFQISMSSGRIYYLRAAQEEDKHKWIGALRYSKSYYLQKGIDVQAAMAMGNEVQKLRDTIAEKERLLVETKRTLSTDGRASVGAKDSFWDEIRDANAERASKGTLEARLARAEQALEEERSNNIGLRDRISVYTSTVESLKEELHGKEKELVGRDVRERAREEEHVQAMKRLQEDRADAIAALKREHQIKLQQFEKDAQDHAAELEEYETRIAEATSAHASANERLLALSAQLNDFAGAAEEEANEERHRAQNEMEKRVRDVEDRYSETLREEKEKMQLKLQEQSKKHAVEMEQVQAQWKEEVQQLNDSLVSVRKELSATSSELESTILAKEKSIHEVAELTEKLRATESERNSVGADLVSLKVQLQEVEKERDEIAEERMSLKTELETVQSSLSDHQAQLKAVKEELSSAVDRSAVLEKRVAENSSAHEQEIVLLQREREEQVSRSEVLQKDLAATKDRMVTLERDSKERLRDAHEGFDRERLQLEIAAKEKDQQMSGALEKLKEAERKNQALSETLETTKQLHATETKQLEELWKEKLEKVEGDLTTRIEKDLATIESLRSEKEREAQSSREAMQYLERARGDLEERLQCVISEKEETATELREVRSASEKQRKQLQEEKLVVEEVLCAEREASVRSKRELEQQMQQSLESLRAEIETMRESHERAANVAKDSVVKLEEDKERAQKDLQEQVDSTKEELSSSNRKLEDAIALCNEEQLKRECLEAELREHKGAAQRVQSELEQKLKEQQKVAANRAEEAQAATRASQSTELALEEFKSIQEKERKALQTRLDELEQKLVEKESDIEQLQERLHEKEVETDMLENRCKEDREKHELALSALKEANLEELNVQQQAHAASCEEMKERHKKQLAAIEEDYSSAVEQSSKDFEEKLLQERSKWEQREEELQVAQREAEKRCLDLRHEMDDMKAEYERKLAAVQLRACDQSRDEQARWESVVADLQKKHNEELHNAKQSAAATALEQEHVIKDAESALSKRREEHEEQLRSVTQQHEEVVATLKTELQSLNSELAACTGSQEEKIAEMHRSREDAVQELRVEHEEACQRLKDAHSEELRKAHDAQVVERSSIKEQADREMDVLRSQITELSAQLALAKQEHTEECKALAAKHDERLSVMKEKHEQRVQELEERHLTMQREFEERHEQLVKAVKEQHAAEQAARLEQQQEDFEEKRMRLQHEIAQLEASCADLKKEMLFKSEEHEKAVQELHGSMEKQRIDREEEILVLKRDHEETITAKESQHASELESLKLAHDRAMANLAEENDMRTCEDREQWRQDREELSGEIERLQKAIAGHVLQEEQLRKELKETSSVVESQRAKAVALAEENNALMQEKKRMIIALKESEDNGQAALVREKEESATRMREADEQHRQALDQARCEWEAERNALRESLKDIRDRALMDSGALESKLQELEAQVEKEQENVRSERTRGQEAVQSLKAEHKAELDRVRAEQDALLKEASEQHATEVAEINAKSSSRLKESQELHAAALADAQNLAHKLEEVQRRRDEELRELHEKRTLRTKTWESEKAESDRRYEEQLQELKAAQTERDCLNEELMSIKSAHEQELSTLRSEMDAIAAERQRQSDIALEECRSHLQSEVEELKSRIEATQQEATAKDAEKHATVTEIESRHLQEVKELESRQKELVSAYEERLTVLAAQHDSFRDEKVKELAAVEARAETTVKTIERECEEIKTENAVAEKRIAELETECNEVQAQIHVLESSLADVQREHDALKELYQSNIEAHGQACAELESTIEKLTVDRSALQKRNEELSASLTDLRERAQLDCGALEQRLIELEQAVEDERVVSAQALEQQQQVHAEELARIHEAHDSELRAQVLKLEDALQEHKRQLSAQGVELESAVAEVTTLKEAEVHQLQSKVEALEESLKQIETEREELSRAVEESEGTARSTIQESSARLRDIAERCEHITKERDEIKIEMEKQLDCLRQQHTAELEKVNDVHQEQLEQAATHAKQEIQSVKEHWIQKMDVQKAELRDLADQEVAEVRDEHHAQVRRLEEDNQNALAILEKEYQTQLHEKEECLSTLSAQVSQWKEQCSSLESANAQLSKDMAMLHEKHREELSDSSQQADRYRSELEALIRDNAESRDSDERLLSSIKQESARREEELLRESAAHKSRVHVLEEEMERLRVSFEGEQATRVSCEEQVESLTAEIALAKEELGRSLKKHKEDLRLEQGARDAAVADAEFHQKRLKERIEELQQSVLQKETETSELSRQIRDMEAVNAEMRETGDVARHKKVVAELERKLSRTEWERDDLRAQIDGNNEEIAKLQHLAKAAEANLKRSLASEAVLKSKLQRARAGVEENSASNEHWRAAAEAHQVQNGFLQEECERSRVLLSMKAATVDRLSDDLRVLRKKYQEFRRSSLLNEGVSDTYITDMEEMKKEYAPPDPRAVKITKSAADLYEHAQHIPFREWTAWIEKQFEPVPTDRTRSFMHSGGASPIRIEPTALGTSAPSTEPIPRRTRTKSVNEPGYWLDLL